MQLPKPLHEVVHFKVVFIGINQLELIPSIFNLLYHLIGLNYVEGGAHVKIFVAIASERVLDDLNLRSGPA